MTTITYLPQEVIILILEDDNISIEDIVNFSFTCKQFRQILQNKFWEKTFYRRCPSAKKRYNIQEREKIFKHVDFKQQIQANIKCIKNLHYYVTLMSDNNIQNTDKTELEYFLRSKAEDPIIYYFIIDEINRIISTQPLWCNLAIVYNLGVILRCLKQYRLAYERHDFTCKPKKKQFIEFLLTIVIQYFQPHVSYSIIEMWLDDIAQEVLSRLKNKYPAHSIFSTPSEKFFMWKNNNIDDNFWNPTEARQIMHIIEEFVFFELEFYKLHQLWKILDLEDKICISGCIRIYLLTIIYHSVARRLGIHCILMHGPDPGPFLLILWKPKYFSNPSPYLGNVECLYVNWKSHLLYPLNVVKEHRNINEFPSNSLNYIEMTYWILLRIIYELITNVDTNKDCTWEYSNVLSIIQNWETFENIAAPIRFKNCLTRYKLDMIRESKRRTENITFAVGIIVRHSCRHLYHLEDSWNITHGTEVNHDGVIIGWVDKCYKHFHKYGEELNYFLNGTRDHLCACRESSDSAHQPHYKILIENDKVCYMPQGVLSICDPKWINHVDIGQFFSRFEGTYYVPNESLAECYPNDITAIPKILSSR